MFHVKACYPIHLLNSRIFTEFSQGNVFHLPWALTRADACCVRDHGILPHQKDPLLPVRDLEAKM